jgi:phage terminase large subunit
MPKALEINPTIKQYEAWQALQNPNIREIHFGGGAGGGKTWLGCESRLARAISMPGYKSFIARNELTRLMKSTYVTWTKVCNFHHIDPSDWKLNGKYNFIELRNGSRIDLLDVAFQPSDPMYERLGSLEYTDGGWGDEASEIHFMAIDILRSRGGRHLNNEYNFKPDSLFTYNPNKGWVYRVYKMWKEGTLPEDTVFIQSLFGDNPFTKEIYGDQLKRIQDPAMRARLMFGSFEYDADPTSLIDYDAAIDLFTNTVEGDAVAEKAITVDVARQGVDKTVIYLWRGWTIYGVRIYAKQDTAVTEDKLKIIAQEESVPYSRIVIDEDGIGGGVLDHMKGARGFIANTPALDNPITKEQENFANVKAQCSYKLADKVNRHKMAVKIAPGQFISEVPGITLTTWQDMFLEELDYIKSKNIDRDTKLKIVSKEDIKLELGRSPDFSDTAMMRGLLEYPSERARGSGIKIIKPKNYSGFNRGYNPRQKPDPNF